MITALISSALGIFGGLVPDIMKEVKATREHKREIDMIQVQADTQVKLVSANLDAKLREMEGNIFVEEMRGFRAQMENIYKQQMRPSGVKWIDGFNSFVRPFAVFTAWIMFLIIGGMYSYWIIQISPDAGSAAQALWGSMVGEVIQAVVGYLFGYRTSSSAAQAIRAIRSR